MNTNQGRLVILWGHLALLAVIAAVVVAYLIDARAVSLKINNLLLVQPASVLALLLVALVVPQCFRRLSPEEAAVEHGESLSDLGKIGALAACFGAFAATLELVGFDVATFLFLVAALFICGERRWWLNLVFSAAFTLVVIYGYGALTPFPFPLTVL